MSAIMVTYILLLIISPKHKCASEYSIITYGWGCQNYSGPESYTEIFFLYLILYFGCNYSNLKRSLSILILNLFYSQNIFKVPHFEGHLCFKSPFLKNGKLICAKMRCGYSSLGVGISV